MGQCHCLQLHLPSLPAYNYWCLQSPSIDSRLLLALNWFNLLCQLWSLSFLPGDLAFFHVRISLSSGSSPSSKHWFPIFLVFSLLHLFFSKIQFCFITDTVTATTTFSIIGLHLDFGSLCAS